MELDRLTKGYIKATYGHSLTVADIQKKYPYSNKPFNRKNIKRNDITVTYNPLQAMQIKKSNRPCIGWGLRDKNNHVFIFKGKKSLPILDL